MKIPDISHNFKSTMIIYATTHYLFILLLMPGDFYWNSEIFFLRDWNQGHLTYLFLKSASKFPPGLTSNCLVTLLDWNFCARYGHKISQEYMNTTACDYDSLLQKSILKGQSRICDDFDARHEINKIRVEFLNACEL